MFFKRLEIIGFKSFGDKTVFEFEPGITTIVGPNGCGKSNVSDAIRWVLGEQSAKALRGGKMEDVIFNGTDERAAINMAEVTFTIEDPDKILPLGFHEISVTRRVFRDGQGEYFINKNPCRLKDIHELFMGTGIGTDAYSILEQGKMDMILNAKPQERRELFEEASGITKFKSKKVEAMRKLEATEENLVRVNDILKEVKRQIQSVQRYAAKARKYRTLLDEMKMLQVAFSRHRYEGIAAALSKLQAELSALYESQKGTQEKVRGAQEELQALRGREEALLDEQEKAREEHSAWEREMNLKESRFRADEQRLDELSAAAGRWESELGEHREKIKKLQAELQAAREESAAWEASVNEARETVAREDAEIRQAQENIRDAAQKQKQLQEQLMEDEMASSRARNEMGGLSASHKGVLVKRERLLAEQADWEGKALALENVLQDAARSAQEQDASVTALRQGAAEASRLCEQFQLRIAEALEQSEKLREALARKKTEWNLLQQWKEEGAGLQPSAQRLLKMRRDNPEAWAGLAGALRDLLRIEPGYEAAAEAALGAWGQDLVVQDASWVEKIREAAKAESGARLSVLSLDGFVPPAGQDKRIAGDSRVLGTLGKFVKAQGRLQELLHPLLDGIYVVRAWEDAKGILSDKSFSDSVVTLAGEFADGGGRITLALGSDTSWRVFGRDNDIARLSLEIERLQENLHDAIVHKGGLVVESEAARATLSGQEEALRQAEIRQATLRHEWEKLCAERERMRGNQAVLAKELEEAQRELERFHHEDNQHQTELVTLETRQKDHARQLQEIAAQLEALTGEREKKLECVTKRKIQMASLEEKLENRVSQAKSLEERLQEVNALARAKAEDSRASAGKIEALKASLAEWRVLEGDLQSQRAARREAVQKVQAQRQECSSQAHALEKALNEARASLSQWSEQQRALEVERAQHEGQREHLRDNLMREFQVDLQSPAPEPQPGETVFSLEAFAGGWDAVAARVAEIRPALDGMGSVNVAALQEHDELQSRYDFLLKEHEDLVAAKQTLLKVISRINTTTRKLFAETFAAIRANFQEIFVQLFGGGKADLLLSDETDILEAGIDIVARPPGKKLQNVSLLSGGEKALTAVALLFAVFQVKPSPFCVLDEIDAPLDESNITRFVSMLRNYAARTQFIVITHNKRTIAKADVLYGITMQESGISKVVSVRLTDAPPAAAPAIPPAVEDRASGTPMFVHPPESAFARPAQRPVEAPAMEEMEVPEESSERSEG